MSALSIVQAFPDDLPPPPPLPTWHVDHTWMWSLFAVAWPAFAVGAVVLFTLRSRRGVAVPEKSIRVCLATAVGLAIFSLSQVVLLGADRGDVDVWGRGFRWSAAVLGTVAGVSLMVAAVAGFVAVAVVGWQRDTDDRRITTHAHVSSGDGLDPP